MFTKLTTFPLFLIIVTSLISGCVVTAKNETSDPTVKSSAVKQITSVDVIRVKDGFLVEPTEYIGTTEPVKAIILRSQTEGQLLDLMVDVGDRIYAGQMIARIDDTLLQAEVAKAEAQLASLNAQVLQAQGEVESAKAEVESAKATFNQAQIDAERLESLYNEGAIAKREVELAYTTAKNALQGVKSAQAQVNIRKAEVETAKGQIKTQQALISVEKKKLAYTEIKSPSNGYVLERFTESGNLLQPGNEVIKIGDFSQVKVSVSVSELELKNMKLNQNVKIKLDAFPNQTFSGIIKRISPAADATVRQIPVEIIIDNPQQLISSGLLARVRFLDTQKVPLIIPQNALELSVDDSENSNSSVFVVDETGESTQVIARQVILGESQNGKVEVIAGLNAQERLVIRSSKPLKSGETVKLSIISED